MNAQQIEKLVKELCNKKVKYKSYDGSMSETTLIERNNETVLEQIIRQHILENRDEKLGVLEAKVFVYEEMIAKSTFAPMLVEKEVEVVKEVVKEVIVDPAVKIVYEDDPKNPGYQRMITLVKKA